jgi:RNA polymerase sigma-70 factor (ECF subfamily)
MKESDPFAEVYRSYHQSVLRAVGRIAPDADTAEDWAQEAWLRILRGLSTFEGRAALGTWIHRVAFTTAMSLYRRDRRRLHLRARWMDGRSIVVIPAPLLRHQLTTALERLPVSMQTVMRLHDIEGLPHREIAARLQVTDSTSRSQLFEGRLRMRRALTGSNESRRRTP